MNNRIITALACAGLLAAVVTCSPRDVALWAAGVTGEGVVMLAIILVSGGIGELVTRLGARVIARQATKETLQQVGKYGAYAVAFGAAAALGIGSNISQQIALDGDYHRGAALASAMLKGALEAVVPLVLVLRLLGSEAVAGGLLTKMQTVLTRLTFCRLASALAVGGIEGGTEFAQEVIDLVMLEFVSENADFLNMEGVWRLLNVAAAGFLVGGLFGGAIPGRKPQPSDPVSRVPPEITNPNP